VASACFSHEAVQMAWGRGARSRGSAHPGTPNYPLCFLLSLQVARWEHKTRALSRAFGSPRAACYCLGAVILLLNCVRSHW